MKKAEAAGRALIASVELSLEAGSAKSPQREAVGFGTNNAALGRVGTGRHHAGQGADCVAHVEPHVT